MGIVLEEADESMFWLELLVDSGIASGDQVHPLLKEANELVAIFVAAPKTIRAHQPRQ
jgi:four helix bundle protein